MTNERFFNTTVSYLTDNIIPTTHKFAAVSISDVYQITVAYDPNSVVLHEATGGFNSVVEIAAEYCLQVFDQDVDLPNVLVQIPADVLQGFRNAQDTPFDSEFLNTFDIHLGRNYGIGITFVPTDIEFLDPHKVCIEYRGDVDLLLEPSDEDLDPLRRLVEGLGGAQPEPSRSLRSRSRNRRNSFSGSPGFESSGTQLSVHTPSAGFAVDPAGVAVGSRFLNALPLFEKPRLFVPFRHIGTILLTVCCDYVHPTEPNLKRVDVFADLTTAESNVEVPPGDVQRFYYRFLAIEEAFIERELTNSSRVRLTPTISLVGRNPSEVTVTEITDFAVRVFHIGDKPRQAIVAAFDIEPGCHGIIEEVQHFIGDRDYGVISDECLINRVFKHKWRLGGFYREIAVVRSITIKRNGKEEDAYFRGVFRLDSLDLVTIDTDSNTRTDYLRLGGRATGIPHYIRLIDGTILGPEEVDFGDPSESPWSVFTTTIIEPRWSSDRELREFQQRAHRDAYQYIARPFSSTIRPTLTQPSGIEVLYTRIEGVTKHIFCLGNFRGTLI